MPSTSRAFVFAIAALAPVLACGSGEPSTANPSGVGGAGAGAGGGVDGTGGATNGASTSATAPGATSTTSTTSTGAGGAGGAPGEPIVAKENEWVWVPVEGMQCADGSASGVGVNLSGKSDRVVVYFQGGGACWDEQSCEGGIPTALNLGGYDEKTFKAEIAVVGGQALFGRDDGPFKDDNFVYLPYCTGDVFAGRASQTYGGKPVRHTGFDNVGFALSRLRGTWPSPGRVFVTGSSAGGIGAGYNFWRFRDAFPQTKAYLLDDSGPPLPPPYLSAELEAKWRKAWNMNETMPADCPKCLDQLDALIDHYAAKYPTTRMAMASYSHDSVISAFYGISGFEFNEGLHKLADEKIGKSQSFRYFIAPGASHVLLATPKTTSVKGTSLWAWMGQMVADDPAWANVEVFK